MAYIADLHVHPAMKPFRYDIRRTLADAIPAPGDPNYCDDLPWKFLTKKIARNIRGESQVNLVQCQVSDTRVVFLSLYPPERNMFKLKPLLNFCFDNEKERNLGACVTGFEKSFVRRYWHEVRGDQPVDYFDETEAVYRYLLQQQQDNTLPVNFCLGEDFTQVTGLLAQPDNFIGVITIEGMHALGKYHPDEILSLKDFWNDSQSTEYQSHKQTFFQNIDTIKQWNNGDHCPLFITFGHHYWNGLCGHARSFSGIMRKKAFDQDHGRNHAFTELGREVIAHLLSRANGRRILIDVKHMSVNSRMEFYRLWEDSTAQGDPFPLICSHAAVNGIPALADARNHLDKEKDYRNTFFNTWSINLCDEDIINIHRSNGLIGMILHEDRMPGGLAQKIIEDAKESGDQDRLRDIYILMLMTNIFHIVKVVGDPSAWDIICLGSDLDGVINSFDIYPDVSHYGTLKIHMTQFLHQPLANELIPCPLSKADFEALRFGLTPEEIMDKLMFQNVEKFMERYYHDDYLKNGNAPVIV